jgi:acyl homoserine lactone synthase
MLHLITPNNYELYREDLDNMYRFRHKIFFEKLAWDVQSQDGMEKDIYDETQMYYLIYKDEDGIIRGCVRFIEMTNDCMLDGPFSGALPNFQEFKRPGYWEMSRVAIDTDSKLFAKGSIVKLLLAGLMEFGKHAKCECYITVTFAAIKNLFKKYGLLDCDLNKFTDKAEEIHVWGFPAINYSLNQLSIHKYNLIKNMPQFSANRSFFHSINMMAMQ